MTVGAVGSSSVEVGDRERALGIRAGDVFVTDPEYRVDARLSRFFTSGTFRSLAPETRRNYVTDVCLFFNFLWGCGKRWDEATADDLWDFQDWRRWSPENPSPVSGSKWNRELAALTKLYSWAVRQKIMTSSPVVERIVAGRWGGEVGVPAARALDARSSNVRWLTPRAFRLWRDVGVRGYGADGRRDGSWRGRHDDRNAAFADLLFCSGMRRTEAGSLLMMELPDLGESGRRYYDGVLAAAVTKSRRARTFYVSADALGSVHAYARTSRAAVVRRAQRLGRYERLDGGLVVSRRSGWKGTVLHLTGVSGQTVQRKLDALGVEERLRLLAEGRGGLEPLWLWLAEDGMPFRPHSWEAVFRAASQRCQSVLSGFPAFTPHMARHSFALCMLVVLQHALDRRFGLDEKERRELRELYGDAWRLVKDLLGHASEEVTRTIYLAPVSDLQLRSLLVEEEPEGAGELLAQIARRSARVLDVTVGA